MLSTSTLRSFWLTQPTLLFATTLELTGSATQFTSTASFVDLLQLERNTAVFKARDTCIPRLDLVAEQHGSVINVCLSDVIDNFYMCCAPAAWCKSYIYPRWKTLVHDASRSLLLPNNILLLQVPCGSLKKRTTTGWSKTYSIKNSLRRLIYIEEYWITKVHIQVTGVGCIAAPRALDLTNGKNHEDLRLQRLHVSVVSSTSITCNLSCEIF